MNAPGSSRPYDIVLFGATGFTGGLTADYLATHLPEHARWAIAGRSRSKLEAVRARLGADQGVQGMDDGRPEVLIADAADPESLRAIAESARVVITTVGPYLQHGGPLVAACAAAGTDYVDLTGEPEFMDRMYLEHHALAQKTGARLVHACGFDSIPHDLGAYFTVKQLPTDGPVAVRGIVRSNAMISGGTFHSGLGQMSRARQMREASSERKQIEPRTRGRRARAIAGSPRRDADLGLWLLPLPTCDPVIVKRSAAARPEYGPDFTYGHYAGMKRLTTLVGASAGVGALAAAAQVGPIRRLLGRAIPQGEGPSEERRARSWFTVDFIGEASGVKVHTRVSGADPGYTETSKMLSEAAMCLAFDDNPATAGQVTTAAAMGDNLLRRLTDAGIEFALVDREVTKP
ncbi:saccharopine dehydrogenase NADP-binding domain-containing protein [Nocardioides sp. NPDC126508]